MFLFQGFFNAKAFLRFKLPFFTAPECGKHMIFMILIAYEAEYEVRILVHVVVTTVSAELLFWF